MAVSHASIYEEVKWLRAKLKEEREEKEKLKKKIIKLELKNKQIGLWQS